MNHATGHEETTRTTCCIVGGGPAGMVLGLLLARCGIQVTVLEKHADFLRDFRGDTVHPTTLQLLEDLGLAERFAQLPQRHIQQVRVPVGESGEFITFGDFTKAPGKYKYIAMVPQWDFLDLLAEEGRKEPTFDLRMNTEATGFVRENGRVNGVHYRTADGQTGTLRATITVACDGRSSLVREIPELQLQDFPTPMDVRWFRVPRLPNDPAGGIGKISNRAFTALLDRGDYYQVASIIAKDTDHLGRREPIALLNRQLAELFPWMRGRDLVANWDDVKVLHVTLDRLRKWHVPGLLAIGDAAHAMSPVGGIGINLAVQDAVAAARHLAKPLRTGTLRRRHVAAIQRRRWLTTSALQGLQRVVHRNVIAPALEGDIDFTRNTPPLPLRVAMRAPFLQRVPPLILAYGAMRERPPKPAMR